MNKPRKTYQEILAEQEIEIRKIEEISKAKINVAQHARRQKIKALKESRKQALNVEKMRLGEIALECFDSKKITPEKFRYILEKTMRYYPDVVNHDYKSQVREADKDSVTS